MDLSKQEEELRRAVKERAAPGWGRTILDGNPYANAPQWLFDMVNVRSVQVTNTQLAAGKKQLSARYGPTVTAEEYARVKTAVRTNLQQAAVDTWETERKRFISEWRQELLPAGMLKKLFGDKGLLDNQGCIKSQIAESVFIRVADQLHRRNVTKTSKDDQLTLWFLCAEIAETASTLVQWTTGSPIGMSDEDLLRTAIYVSFDKHFATFSHEMSADTALGSSLLAMIEIAVEQAAEYEQERKRWGFYFDAPSSSNPECAAGSDQVTESILGSEDPTKSAVNSILHIYLDDIAKTLSWPQSGLPLSIRYCDPNTVWNRNAVIGALFQFHAFQHFLRSLALCTENAPEGIDEAARKIAMKAKALPEITDMISSETEQRNWPHAVMEVCWSTTIELLRLSDELRDIVNKLSALTIGKNKGAATTLGSIRYLELFYRITRHERQKPFTCGRALLSASSETGRAHIRVPAPPFALMSTVVKTARKLKTNGEIRTTGYSERDQKKLYSSLISQLTLAHAAAVFAFFDEGVCHTVTVDVTSHGRDPATGMESNAPMSSTVITRADIDSLDLRHVDPTLCLKRLGARISHAPEHHKPIRPFDTLDREDPRIVPAQDILSGLDNRPNLMDLTPSEFESMVQNLFEEMGLDTEQTRPSRDGGVDAIAFDPRPLLGGKIVIQAKRYKNTVGVAAVRDLFGTMTNEGASKGILVTTSSYGSASFEFARGKPLELIDGPQLLFLLKEHSNIEAKIVMPDNEPDPTNTTDY